jgi:hypothetical protein
MSVIAILTEAKAAGIHVKLDGGRLLMKADRKPPDELIAALKLHRDEIRAWLEAEKLRDATDERAAIIEHDGGAPRSWAEALARLDPTRPPGDVPAIRWLRFVDDCGSFLDHCAAKADALKWTPLQLFAADRVKPFARISRSGLLWIINGRKLAALTAGAASIITPSGGRLTFNPKTIEPGGVLPWELQ